jgi:hypothetical protein
VDSVRDESFTLRTSVGGSMDIAFTDVESADNGHVTLSLSGEELTPDLEP